jgi:hypothetical protein
MRYPASVAVRVSGSMPKSSLTSLPYFLSISSSVFLSGVSVVDPEEFVKATRKP